MLFCFLTVNPAQVTRKSAMEYLQQSIRFIDRVKSALLEALVCELDNVVDQLLNDTKYLLGEFKSKKNGKQEQIRNNVEGLQRKLNDAQQEYRDVLENYINNKRLGVRVVDLTKELSNSQTTKQVPPAPEKKKEKVKKKINTSKR